MLPWKGRSMNALIICATYLCATYILRSWLHMFILLKMWLHLSSSRIPHATTWNVVSIWFSRISFIPMVVDICYFLQIVPWSLTFCSQLAYMTLCMGHVLLSSFYVCIWIIQWNSSNLETINLKRFILLVTTLNVLDKILDSLHSRRQCLHFQGSASFLWNVAYFSLGWPYVFCWCRQWDTRHEMHLSQYLWLRIIHGKIGTGNLLCFYQWPIWNVWVIKQNRAFVTWFIPKILDYRNSG